MKACARTSGKQQVKRKALRVALGAFEKLRSSSHLSASPFIYDPLFLTIANASKGQEYIKLVSEVFKFCCEDGALDDVILRTLRRRAPKDVLRSWLASMPPIILLKSKELVTPTMELFTDCESAAELAHDTPPNDAACPRFLLGV